MVEVCASGADEGDIGSGFLGGRGRRTSGRSCPKAIQPIMSSPDDTAFNAGNLHSKLTCEQRAVDPKSNHH